MSSVFFVCLFFLARVLKLRGFVDCHLEEVRELAVAEGHVGVAPREACNDVAQRREGLVDGGGLGTRGGPGGRAAFGEPLGASEVDEVQLGLVQEEGLVNTAADVAAAAQPGGGRREGGGGGRGGSRRCCCARSRLGLFAPHRRRCSRRRHRSRGGLGKGLGAEARRARSVVASIIRERQRRALAPLLFSGAEGVRLLVVQVAALSIPFLSLFFFFFSTWTQRVMTKWLRLEAALRPVAPLARAAAAWATRPSTSSARRTATRVSPGTSENPFWRNSVRPAGNVKEEKKEKRGGRQQGGSQGAGRKGWVRGRRGRA